MAPFVIMWDADTFNLGNIEIQPGISNSIKYDINYKSTIFSLQYTHEDSPIAEYQATYDSENDRLIYRSENMDYSKMFSAMVGMPIKITDWWRTQNNLIYTYQTFDYIYRQHYAVNPDPDVGLIATNVSEDDPGIPFEDKKILYQYTDSGDEAKRAQFLSDFTALESGGRSRKANGISFGPCYA